jgi:putative transposase
MTAGPRDGRSDQGSVAPRTATSTDACIIRIVGADTRANASRLLSEHGIECRMSRSGNCWDNAVAESFFSTMKVARTDRKIYSTRYQAKANVFDYIERFYNALSRHSTLGYVSPIDLEKMAAVA